MSVECRGRSPRVLTLRMVMNDKMIFDRHYCIYAAQTKGIMAHYILQPRHIFIRKKAFILMRVPDRAHLLVDSA